MIDAMDLLHTGRFDAFCLVSSDSDFTRLAARIREQGIDVYGFGEAKTPASFRQACRRFIYTENLVATAETTAPASADDNSVPTAPSASIKQPPKDAVPLIETALGQMDDFNGWYFLGAVGNRLLVLMPDFDPRTYGCAKLVTLIEKSEAFEVRRDNLMIYIKPKAARTMS